MATTPLQRTIQNALNKVGGRGVLVHFQDGPYDPATRQATRVEARYTVSISRDAASQDKLGQMFGPGLLRGGEELLLVQGNVPSDPTPGDRLLFEGKTFEVVKAQPVHFKGSVAVFNCLVKL